MTDPDACRGDLAQAVARAVSAGVDWVQVRDRALDGGALLALCERVAAAARAAAAARGREVRVLVNRRVDVALAMDADGVHLGFDGMHPASARRLLGEEALVGLSLHAPGELPAAGPASYVHLAPIFPPLSKAPARPPLGLDALQAAAAGGVPVLAQGGIAADNAGDALRAGAAGVAVTGAILLRDDPGAAAACLRRALDAAERRA